MLDGAKGKLGRRLMFSNENQPSYLHNKAKKLVSMTNSTSKPSSSYSPPFVSLEIPQPTAPLQPLPSSSTSFSIKRLTLLELLKLNAIVCGIEFCGSAAFCFIPPILLKAGLGEQNMATVLGVGPLIGLFIVPLIGRWSDSCRSSWGRRRPYIFFLSILLLFSMLILLSAQYIGQHIFNGGEIGKLFTTFFLVLGSILLDFTCQTCLTPCEALLSDLSLGSNQHSICFRVYSFMISFGGCVGYLITALDWSDNFVGLFFGSQENCVFILLIIMYSLSMLITFSAAKEKTLSEIMIKKSLPSSEVKSLQQKEEIVEESRPFNKSFQMKWSIDSHNIKFFGKISEIFFFLKRFFYLYILNFLPTPLKRLFDIPLSLKQLALANFFSWTAIMTFNLFYTDYVGQAIFKGNPNAPEDSPLRSAYDNGVRMGSWGLFWHCILSAIYAAFIDRVVQIFDLRTAYLVGMFSFTLSILLMIFTSDLWLVNICATCTGFGFATVTTVPYNLLSTYHHDLEVYFSDTHNGLTIPSRGIGADLSTLDSAYFLSQVILTLCVGCVIRTSGNVTAYLVTSLLASFISLFCISHIILTPNHMNLSKIKTDKVSS